MKFNMDTFTQKGFTLIELLIVIGIIAILSIVVILVLNPTELLRQSRDSNRISDLSVVKSAISFYLTSVTSPYVGTSSVCYVDAQLTSTLQPAAQGTSTCVSWFATNYLIAPYTLTASTSITKARNVDGTGWIPIPFITVSPGGSPIANEPVDPVNNNGINFYSYIGASTSTLYKMATKMESQKYGYQGSNDVVSTDGGIDVTTYEVGTSLSL